MSFAEIQAEIPKLRPEERAALRQQLESMRRFEDPAFMADLSRRIEDAEQGINMVPGEEVVARLRALGKSV
jgi:hypothetical protein